MNEIELTKLFVEYKETAVKLAELEAQIQAEVLAIGDSQKIAGVKATYYKPSFETPDYRAAATEAHVPDDVIKMHTVITESVSWKAVCEHCGIDAPLGAEKPARVVVKV